MERSNIEKIAHTDEDRYLLAMLWDKINGGMRKNIISAAGFLSPREQEMAQYLFGNAEGLYSFGGYEGAERRMAVFLPDYLDEESLYDPELSPVVCIRAVFYQNDELCHRDFLGALMHLGIERETLGDIVLLDGGAHVHDGLEQLLRLGGGGEFGIFTGVRGDGGLCDFAD